MRINNNLMAMNTHRQLGLTNSAATKSMEKLSSGYRINRAGDDAAGLSISEKMRAQIRGLTMASRNAQDGISLIQTAEGALQETHAILQRMRELAVQSANDTNVEKDREAIQAEIDELAKEITRIANNTEFNTQKLINGGITKDGIGEVRFHIGANSSQDIALSIRAMDAKSLGVSRDIVSASGTVTGGTVISTVSFSGSLGAAIVDGAEVSFAYTSGSPAEAAKITGSGAVTSALTAAGTLVLNIDGVVHSVSLSTGATLDAIISAINDQVAPGTATKDSNKIVIQSGTTGSSSSVEIVGSSDDFVVSKLNLTEEDPAIGQDATPAELKLTAGTHTQVLTVGDGTANTLTISDGAFKGMTITLDSGKTIANISDADKITISADIIEAKAAEFIGGALVSEAVTEAGIDVSTQAAASAAITTINNAIELVSAERSKLGAYQNRLEHTIRNLDTSAENLQASESRIRDVDMAKEMMELTKQNILQQAATAMLAQANQAPQGVLQLLR